MLNPALDLSALAAEYTQTRRIRINEFLSPAAVQPLLMDITRQQWKVFCADGAQVRIIELAELAQMERPKQLAMQHALLNAASLGQGFAYQGVQLTDAWAEGAKETPLAKFRDALNGAEILDAIAKITGRSDFDCASAQATHYKAGNYLTRHKDDPGGGRKVAFSLGLTPEWHPDWGGLLQFFTSDGAPTRSFTPAANTLDLFEVGHVHSVTFVAPYCARSRFEVFGWFSKR